MSILEYTRKRLNSCLEQIELLKESEFPYKDSEEALLAIEKGFKSYLILVQKLLYENRPQDDPEVHSICTRALRALSILLPIMGFILRSTNVRNAFEIFYPFLRLAVKILEPNLQVLKNRKTKLLISSEWNYSPHIYTGLKELPGYLLIGLPAVESANPLLIPLTGHELGHMVWVEQKLKIKMRKEVGKKLLDVTEEKWEDYVEIFKDTGPKPSEQREEPVSVNENLHPALVWTMKQLEESFCDFLALKIFEKSYLHAFSYLLSPTLPGGRSPRYPSIRTRVDNLIDAAKNEYHIEIPDDYELMFTDEPRDEDIGKPKPTRADTFRLEVADETRQMYINTIRDKAQEIVDAANALPTMNDSKDTVNRIYQRYQKTIPAENTRGLPDILNAAWMAFEKIEELWSDIPKSNNPDKDVLLKEKTLKDLVLKNIEVYEFERRTKRIG